MSSWGGKRAGAGRKSTGIATKTVSFRMPEDVAERAQALRAAGIDVTGKIIETINKIKI